MIESLLARFQKLSTIYLITTLAVLTVVCYFNTLGNGLFYDDEFFIYNNAYVQHFSVVNFFTENVDAGGGILSNYYRPLLLILFSLTYQLFGTLGGPYHALSVLFHLSAGVGVFMVFKKLSSKTIAFVTSVLFLIHPIQTESISYASGISDPMYVTFIMLTILCFLYYSKKSMVLAPLFFLLALLSKEAAFVTPALILLCLWMKEKSFRFTDYKTYVPAFTLCLLVLFVYGFLRLTVLNFDNTLNFIHDTSVYSTHLSVRLLTFISILPTYMGLLLYPKTLFIDRVAPIITTVNIQIVFTILTALVIFILPLTMRYKPYAISFSIAWFFISFIPASGITPINGIIYEHFLYLPSIGFFFLLSSLCSLVYKRLPSSGLKAFLCLLLTTYCLLLSIRTIIRNADWNSPFTFYPQLLANNPQSVRALNNYGMALAGSGKQQEAITYYLKANKLPNGYPQIYLNLGNSYAAIGDYTHAETAYKQAITKSPSFYRAYTNLYGIYLRTKQTEKRKALLDTVAQKGKTDPNFHDLYQYLIQVNE